MISATPAKRTMGQSGRGGEAGGVSNTARAGSGLLVAECAVFGLLLAESAALGLLLLPAAASAPPPDAPGSTPPGAPVMPAGAPLAAASR